MNLTIVREYHGSAETIVTLNWQQPPQNGLSVDIVDSYIIRFSTAPLSPPNVSITATPPWNVTLAHNTPYTVNLSANNCVGESPPSTLLLSYSKWFTLMN